MLRLFRKYNRYLIKVNYKSGHSEKFWAYEFRMIGTQSYEWRDVGSKEPFHLGIENIESVWLLKTKKGRNVWPT